MNKPLMRLNWWLLGLACGLGLAIVVERTHQTSTVHPWTVETFEPPLALGPEPIDPNERIGWIERIVERRMTRAFESDPDAKGGPFMDVLAVKLAQFIRKLLKVALELAIATAIGLYVWNHWYVILAWTLGHLGLSWVAGRFGAKKGT